MLRFSETLIRVFPAVLLRKAVRRLRTERVFSRSMSDVPFPKAKTALGRELLCSRNTAEVPFF